MATKGTIIVTGANGALGSAIVGHIVQRPDLASNYTGIYTVRKTASATQLAKALQSAPASHKNQTLEMDLGSIASVRKTAAHINRQVAGGQLPPIRALIFNAGYQDGGDAMYMSEDGYEMNWQVNYLANFILCLLLLQSMDKENGRILIVGSWSHDVDDKRNENPGHAPYGDPKWRDLFPGAEELATGKWSTPQDDSTYSGMRRYGASKLCATMLHQELGNRLAQDPVLKGIAVVGLDPGAMASPIARRAGFLKGVFMMQYALGLMGALAVRWNPNGMLRTPWKTGGDAVRACFDIDVPPGEALYLNGTDKADVGKAAKDEARRKALWAYSVEVAGIKAGETPLGDWL